MVCGRFWRPHTIKPTEPRVQFKQGIIVQISNKGFWNERERPTNDILLRRRTSEEFKVC